jgi:hypothetical protein
MPISARPGIQSGFRLRIAIGNLADRIEGRIVLQESADRILQHALIF